MCKIHLPIYLDLMSLYQILPLLPFNMHTFRDTHLSCVGVVPFQTKLHRSNSDFIAVTCCVGYGRCFTHCNWVCPCPVRYTASSEIQDIRASAESAGPNAFQWCSQILLPHLALVIFLADQQRTHGHQTFVECKNSALFL